MNASAIRGFRRICFSTLIAVYLLILVGGVVRSSGSGMGCPDWPKCFGNWVPPTSVTQLPDNYREVNAAFREKKNLKFIRFLRAVGLNASADQLERDKSVGTETEFNLTKTWIEYINRLVGVVIGLFIIGMFGRSIRLRKTNPPIFYCSLATLIAVIIQGWFGSIVVSTNLTAWTVTVHMFLALLIVALLVYLFRLSEDVDQIPAEGLTQTLLIACMATLLIQIFFGTQVRESIDRIASLGMERERWISQLGLDFIIHRSFSLVVLVLHVLLMNKLTKTSSRNTLSVALIVIILGTLATGAGLAYGGVSAGLQPVHLLMATVAFGMQLLLFLRMMVDKARFNDVI